MEKINIGIVGAGNIGSEVIKIVQEQQEAIAQKTGKYIEIRKIAVKDKKKHDEIDQDLLTEDYREIIDDKSIQTVVELVGGYETAHDIITRSIAAKKNVVTANKAVLARFGYEIFKAADKHGVSLNFEASVGGSIPIIRTISQALASDNIQSIYGILNGTTNYILSKMEDGISYDSALKEAQEKGLAEPDPTFDVEGLDAAQKIVILSRLAFSADVSEDIDCIGISGLIQKDIQYASDLGYKVKLLAIAKKEHDKLEISTKPVMISKHHSLASVNDEMNAVFLIAKNAGPSMLYGKGAGSSPTASVIISDILHKSSFSKNKGSLAIIEDKDICRRFYLRLMLDDKPGVLATFTKVLGEHGISINAVFQKEDNMKVVPVIVITHKSSLHSIKKAVQKIHKLDAVREPPVYMAIEDI